MTNENIESYIDSLNRNEFSNYIFRSMLSDNVDFSKVWAEVPKGNVANEGSYNFYFIKNDDGVYVAAVLDMYSDLHIFVKSEHRKQGHLSSAINSVILPHIGQTGRKKQVITFEDPSIGEYCVRNWKFSMVSESSAEKSLDCYQEMEKIPCKGYKLSSSDFEEIKIKIRKAKLYISMVKEQLESSLCKIEDTDVDFIEQDLFNLEDNVLTLIKEVQGKLA